LFLRIIGCNELQLTIFHAKAANWWLICSLPFLINSIKIKYIKYPKKIYLPPSNTITSSPFESHRTIEQHSSFDNRSKQCESKFLCFPRIWSAPWHLGSQLHLPPFWHMQRSSHSLFNCSPTCWRMKKWHVNGNTIKRIEKWEQKFNYKVRGCYDTIWREKMIESCFVKCK
jgi:hypothetical protein